MNKLSLRNERQIATVAQSVEQLIRNQQVAGSSPASSSKNKRLCKEQCINACFFTVLHNYFRQNVLKEEWEILTIN